MVVSCRNRTVHRISADLPDGHREDGRSKKDMNMRFLWAALFI